MPAFAGNDGRTVPRPERNNKGRITTENEPHSRHKPGPTEPLIAGLTGGSRLAPGMRRLDRFHPQWGRPPAGDQLIRFARRRTDRCAGGQACCQNPLQAQPRPTPGRSPQRAGCRHPHPPPRSSPKRPGSGGARRSDRRQKRRRCAADRGGAARPPRFPTGRRQHAPAARRAQKTAANRRNPSYKDAEAGRPAGAERPAPVAPLYTRRPGKSANPLQVIDFLVWHGLC
jgi:hypothetical protein